MNFQAKARPWKGKKQMGEMQPTWRDSKGRFIPGNPGLPGRPKGSRNLLADAMIDDLYRDWKEHGIQAIRAARESRPVEYLKVVAVIVSKAEDLSGVADGMYDAALAEIIEERRQAALLQIEKMREEPGPAWPNGRNGEQHD
jgi:hypothetical protein